ncbi:Tautomerase enzyme [Arthrobacter subterraneus]|uniref:Tautomerase enzyme n=1 Tax=Arthrobacter subterraneus TaxID=335973 RepID=A0A1G8HDG7_9MICC|nr:tautomerase family protein [Arthrobacter subterraneus]SDI04530.1 Tautomerase enzyme [Arthrobacter subterraneus]
MPLVRIDVNTGRTPQQVQDISSAVHRAIVDEYRIPERDLFHILTEHPSGQLRAQDAGLGFERSEGVVMIQIFTQRGRSQDAKTALFARVASSLGQVGVDGADIFIGYVENGAGDWSFGFGRAQYVTGELAVPSAAGAM